MKLTLTLVAVFCLSIAPVACAAASGDQKLTPLPDLAPAPQFDLETPDGERIRLSDYRGKPVIVNFWATWCPPCRAEMPSFQRAWDQVKGEGISVIAINVGEDADTIRQFTERVAVSFPLPMDQESRVVQAWPVRGLPTTFVVDPLGRLAFVATGEREWDDAALLDEVRALLKETR
jgi:peroxiredoxin